MGICGKSGEKRIFSTGSQISSDEANYYGFYPYLIEENYETHENPDVVEGGYRGTTVNVSSFAPNAYGLYNMHGNVSGWCLIITALILYQGNSLVIYYDDNSWDFTRIGKIDGVTQEELKEALGDGDVEVTFSLDEEGEE